MSKHTNSFLDGLNKGDKVYLAIFPRGYGDAWLGEVEFQSKTMKTEKVLWDEPRCIPSYITEYYYTIRFKDGKKAFTVTLQDHGWCKNDYLESTAIDLSATDMLVCSRLEAGPGGLSAVETDVPRAFSYSGSSPQVPR